ncbi:MAG: cache domain-containing protein [Myxococcota bacterium]
MKLNERERELFKKSITLMGMSISKLEQDNESEGIHALLAIPLILKNQLTGVLMASIDSEAIHKIITQQSEKKKVPFETALAFAKNHQLQVIHSAGRMFGLSASQRAISMGSSQAQGLQKALRGNWGSGQNTNNQGIETLAAWKYLPHANLAIVAKLEKQLLFSSMVTFYLLAAAGVLLLNLLFLLVARRKDRMHKLHRYAHASKDIWHTQARWALNGFLGISLLVTACGTGFFIHRYMQTQNQLHKGLDSEARFKLQQASQKINHRIKTIETLAYAMAEDLGVGRLKKEDIPVRLKRILKEQPNIFGMGVAYAPYAYKPNVRLYAPYMRRTHKGIEGMHIEDTYDYTLPQSLGGPKTDWYNKPFAANKAMWTKPYFGSASQKFISSYVIPFYHPKDQNKKQPIGVIEVMQDLDDLRHLATAFSLHGIGYTFIASKDGRYIYHPIEEYVEKQLTIKEISQKENLEAIEDFTSQLLKETQNTDVFVHGNASSWVYSKQIPGTDWIFAIAFEESDLQISNQILKNSTTGILICGLLFVLLAAALILQNIPMQRDRSALYSAIFTCSAFLTLVAFWSYMFVEPPRVELTHSTPISERAEVDRYVKSFHKARPTKRALLQIPTGITLESIEFIDFQHASIKGYCWQKYPSEEQMDHGIVIANAVEADFQEVYREKRGNLEVVGWNFTATVVQKNNHWRYPFDDQNIVILLENADLNVDAILTPDANSYELLHPTSTPGIAKDLLDSMPIQRSLFAYTEQKPETTLGLSEDSNLRAVPNLAFIVAIKRSIVNPIVFYFIPLMTTLICMYLLFVMQHKIDRGELVSSYLTLLFTIILLHQVLRTELEAREMFYIEHFFLISYVIILAVFLNVFFEAKDPPITWITRTLRLIFWPSTLTLWILSTVYVFLR